MLNVGFWNSQLIKFMSPPFISIAISFRINCFNTNAPVFSTVSLLVGEFPIVVTQTPNARLSVIVDVWTVKILNVSVGFLTEWRYAVAWFFHEVLIYFLVDSIKSISQCYDKFVTLVNIVAYHVFIFRAVKCFQQKWKLTMFGYIRIRLILSTPLVRVTNRNI